MADIPRRSVLCVLALAPLLAVRPMQRRYVTIPAGFSGGFNSGLTEYRMRAR